VFVAAGRSFLATSQAAKGGPALPGCRLPHPVLRGPPPFPIISRNEHTPRTRSSPDRQAVPGALGRHAGR
jgi:hypothetical protein